MQQRKTPGRFDETRPLQRMEWRAPPATALSNFVARLSMLALASFAQFAPLWLPLWIVEIVHYRECVRRADRVLSFVAL